MPRFKESLKEYMTRNLANGFVGRYFAFLLPIEERPYGRSDKEFLRSISDFLVDQFPDLIPRCDLTSSGRCDITETTFYRHCRDCALAEHELLYNCRLDACYENNKNYGHQGDWEPCIEESPDVSTAICVLKSRELTGRVSGYVEKGKLELSFKFVGFTIGNRRIRFK